jgi:hypothetical protein
MELGLQDISDKEYHADRKFLSASMIKTYAESPSRYAMMYEHGLDPMERSASLAIGSAVHLALAEAGDDDSYVVFDGVRRGKKFEEFKQAAGDRMILNRAEEDTVNCCLDAVSENHIHKALIDGAKSVEREKAFVWECADTGALCKFKFDLFLSRKYLVDYKTIGQFSERSIYRAIADRRYDLQAAHYIAGAHEMTMTSDGVIGLLFCFIETKAPYRVGWVILDDESLDRAFSDRVKIIEQMRRAREQNDYRDEFEKQINLHTTPEYLYRG